MRAGHARANAEVLRDVLAGEPGPERSLTLLNAAAAIYVGGRADSHRRRRARAPRRRSTTGAAQDVLERYVARTRELATA